MRRKIEMNLFDWLLVSHLVGDFLFQSDGMARHKTTSWCWMLRHLSIYTAIVSLVLVGHALIDGVPAWTVAAAILFIFGTHLLLDRRQLTVWWMRHIGIAPNHPWLPIVVDQVFHVLTLAIVAQVLSLVQP